MPNVAKPFPFTQAYLRSRLHYNKKTGAFTWRETVNFPAQWNTRYAGNEAGTPHPNGYVLIRLDGKPYLAHRLAWFYVHGEQPDEVDHKNTVKHHNRLNNLRPATTSQNEANKAAYKNNTSGFKGVSRKRNKWRAQIKVRGVPIYLGVYDTPEKAHAAYIRAAKKYAKSFARWETPDAFKRKPYRPMDLKGHYYAH